MESLEDQRAASHCFSSKESRIESIDSKEGKKKVDQQAAGGTLTRLQGNEGSQSGDKTPRGEDTGMPCLPQALHQARQLEGSFEAAQWCQAFQVLRLWQDLHIKSKHASPSVKNALISNFISP